MKTVGQRYELGEQLGAGGKATVWRAWDQRLARPVAIKILSPILAADPGFQARFEREARQVAGLNHPNIVTVFDYGSDDQGVP
jgi:serine/threonine protein kinase